MFGRGTIPLNFNSWAFVQTSKINRYRTLNEMKKLHNETFSWRKFAVTYILWATITSADHTNKKFFSGVVFDRVVTNMFSTNKFVYGRT